MKYCPFCGQQHEDDARYCGICGHEFAPETQAPQPKGKKSWLIVLLVAVVVIAAAVVVILLFTGKKDTGETGTSGIYGHETRAPETTGGQPQETEASEPDASEPDAPEFEMREETIEFRLSDGTLYYSNTIEYPYFTGTSDVEAKLNRRYADKIKSCKSNDTDFDAAYESASEWTASPMALPYYDNVTAEVVCRERGALSVKEVLAMWSGGAHVYYYETGLNYDLSTGKELTVGDILEGDGAQVDSVLKYYFGKTLREATDTEIAALKEYTAYTLRKDGLCFYYNVGDAAPRAEIVIPYTSEDSYRISAQKLLEQLSEPVGETEPVSLEGYGDIVEQAIQVMHDVYSFAKGDGMLYDVNGDGIPELIILYFAKVDYKEIQDLPACVYSIYTISDGSVVPIAEEELLFPDAGGPTASISVVEKDGRVYLAMNEENGSADENTLLREGHWYLYSLQETTLTLETTIGYNLRLGWEDGKDKIMYEDSSATIDGKEEPYTALEAWLDSFSELASVQPWPETGGLQELLTQLS